MTREEAKHIVDVVFDVPQAVRRAGEDRTYHEDEIREAKQMAIKALEQEPCEDAISRDMALEKMADYVASGYADSVEDFEEYSRIICQLPPVKPQEPKTGHWIGDNQAFWIYAKCSECGSVHNTATNYCPNCGCLMEYEEETE